jgi:hypothetical protein
VKLAAKARNTDERHIIATPPNGTNFLCRKIHEPLVKEGLSGADGTVLLRCI